MIKKKKSKKVVPEEFVYVPCTCCGEKIEFTLEFGEVEEDEDGNILPVSRRELKDLEYESAYEVFSSWKRGEKGMFCSAECAARWVCSDQSSFRLEELNELKGVKR